MKPIFEGTIKEPAVEGGTAVCELDTSQPFVFRSGKLRIESKAKGRGYSKDIEVTLDGQVIPDLHTVKIRFNVAEVPSVTLGFHAAIPEECGDEQA